MQPPKIRTCAECKNTFLTPTSFREHKNKLGNCRNNETLRMLGFTETPSGWILARTTRKK